MERAEDERGSVLKLVSYLELEVNFCEIVVKILLHDFSTALIKSRLQRGFAVTMENNEPRLLNLGPAGYLLELEVCTGEEFERRGKKARTDAYQTSENMPGAEQDQRKPRIVVILDRSGSMGAWTKYATNSCVPGALQQVGYQGDEEVIFITFDSKVERVQAKGRDPTIAQLRNLPMACRGCTNMSGVIIELERVFSSNAADAYHVLVISDGAIGDQVQTAIKAADASARLQKLNQKTRISCSLFRFLSAKHAQPDTRALTCIQLFCTTSDVTALVDVSNGDGVEEVGVLNLTEALVQGCKSAGVGSAVVISTANGEALMRASPAQSERTATLRVPCNGQRVYLLLDEPVKTIKLGNVEVSVLDAGIPKDVAALNAFVEVSGQALKMNLVAMGANVSAELKSRIASTLAYFDQVQTFLAKMQTDALMADDGGDSRSKAGVAARAKAVAKRLKSATVNSIDLLRQQLNADKVTSLNAQQTADWLRNVNVDTKSSRSLAKRTEGSDFEGDARAAVPKLAAAYGALKLEAVDDDFDNVSFYSQSNFAECLMTSEDLMGVAADLTMGDWMQAIGGVGVPFQADAGNFVDPWQFRIKPSQLFAGQLLAEPDVWLTCVQAGSSTMTLACPGRPNTNISGVIPLRSLNPACYDIYMRQGRVLAEQQASAQMRRVVACVPYDVIALSTAGFWSLCCQGGVLTSLEKTLLSDLRANVVALIGGAYKSAPFKEVYDNMCLADPRPFMTGDLGMTNILKAVACLLKFSNPEDATKLKAAYRALYYLEAYHMSSRAFRGEDGPALRKQALSALFQIDLNAHATPIQPLFEPEPEAPAHYDELAPEALVLPAWVPQTQPYVVLCSLVNEGNVTTEAVFGVSPAVLSIVAAAQSIACSGESDRVDTATRTAHIPDPVSPEDALAYLKTLQRKLYDEDYQTRLAEKRKTEERIRTERLVNKLYELPTLEEFLRDLQEISNREHAGFGMLLERITGAHGEACPLRLVKLAVLICGRDISNEKAGPVWANGNFYKGEWEKFESLFCPKAAKAWEKLQKFHAKYGLYKYPKGGDKNRHGHSDAFPSFFALGFKSLYDMQQKASPEAFAKYLREHCGEKGCCLPQVELERTALVAAAGGGNDNNATPALPRPQTAQEKTDARRARRDARGGGNKKNVKGKKGAKKANTVPAKKAAIVKPAVKEGKE